MFDLQYRRMEKTYKVIQNQTDFICEYTLDDIRSLSDNIDQIESDLDSID